MKSMKVILPFLAFLAITAYGQMQQRVAVINTLDDGEPPIKHLELSYLTDKLRETAIGILPKSRYGVMTTESIVAFLGSEERAVKICREASCLAELGRKVSADYVAQARIGRFGNDLTIKTELYETKSGNLIGSFAGYSKDIYGLLALIEEKAPNLFKQMPTVSSSSITAPPAVPPAVAFAAPQEDIAPAPIKPVLAPIAKPTTPPHPPIEWCDKMYNINEIIFKLRDGLLGKLRDCSSEQKTESFSMTQCATDWIKKELPDDFPATNRILGFSSLGKLVSTVGGDYENYELSDKTLELFLSEVKRLSADKCIVDEPYEPPIERKQLRSSLFSLGLPQRLQIGFRAGINSSPICGPEINDIYRSNDDYYGLDKEDCSKASLGMQFGFVFDIAVFKWLSIQPGLMYSLRGMQGYHTKDDGIINQKPIHYLEFPLLLSFKYYAISLNAGPYFGIPIAGDDNYTGSINVGIGLDIGMFYIGAFLLYCRELPFGLNVGVNL